MIPMITCPNGHTFRSVYASMSGTVMLFDNEESCPACGIMCSTPNGTFRLGDEVLAAIRQPGITRDKVQAFRDVAQAVAGGGSSVETAATELEQVSAAFAKILKATNQNAPALGVLIGLLTIILSYYAIVCSNDNAAVAHADAQAQLIASQQQTIASETAQSAQQKIEEDLARLNAEVARLNALSEAQPATLPPTLQRPIATQQQRPSVAAYPNRHERRKAKRLAKRKKP